MARSLSSSKTKVARRQTLKPPAVKAKSKLGPIGAGAIELVKTLGSRERGGGPGGEAWVILADGKRAGTAYINVVDDSIRGLHASFHVFLNRPSQGRQIGRAAYLRCCLLSQYDVVYAHMRKSNVASRKAAEHAGFVDATRPGESQLVLVWNRPNAEAVDINGSPMSSITLSFDEKIKTYSFGMGKWSCRALKRLTSMPYFRALRTSIQQPCLRSASDWAFQPVSYRSI